MKRQSSRLQRSGLGVGILAVVSLLTSGCRLNVDLPLQITADVFGNVDGWNLSACGGGGFRTCAQLLMDNQRLILNGMTVQEAVNDTVIGFATTLDRIEVNVAGIPLG